MRIIKLNVEGEGFYVLLEARIGTTPNREVDTVWVRISGREPIDEAAANTCLARYPGAEVIERTEFDAQIMSMFGSRFWGRLPEGVTKGRVV